MKDKTKIYIDLSKCSEEQQNYIFSLLPESLSSLQYEIDEYNFILDYEDDEWWVNGTKPPVFKQELTYPEFIKLFENQKTITESLKEYFKNTPKDQVIKDWESVSEFDNVNSPKVSELFEGGDDNNGWIKIESESDLPKLKIGEIIHCFIKSSDYENVGMGVFSQITNSFLTHFHNHYENVTHYQPIIKPDPPKF